MPCIDPPPLKPDQLSAAIDGEAGPEVHDHLSRCEHCAARLHDAQKAERRLARGLYRWDCPSPAVLGEYHLGALPSEAESAITGHLAQCAKCSDELATLRVFMASEASEASSSRARPEAPARAAGAALGEIVARLLPRSLGLALRGEAREPVVAEAEGVMIILDMQPADKGRVSILGQVAADTQDQWTSALVQLRQSGDLQAMATVSELGTFKCRSVLPGATEIRITPVVGHTIVVPNIHIAA